MNSRQIGVELGHKGMQDEEVIPFLLTLRRPTLFTRDLGLYTTNGLRLKPDILMDRYLHG